MGPGRRRDDDGVAASGIGPPSRGKLLRQPDTRYRGRSPPHPDAPMIDYRSDNTGRAAPEILDALIRANSGTALGYGADEWTARLQERFGEVFETRLRVF